MVEVHGSCDAAFNSVTEILRQKLTDGPEVGVSLCVDIDGKNVLDLWGGHADAGLSKSWDKDTITGVWSSTKIPTTLAAHILIDRGLLDLNEKVATYWPEFAANGKENTTVAHILSHCSGIPAFGGPITMEEYLDYEKSTQRLAAQAPFFEPGSQSAYNYSSWGHMIGELVRRTTGKSLAQFIAEEIAKPLDADFQLGVSEEDWARTADLISFEREAFQAAMGSLDPDPSSIMNRTVTGSIVDPTTPNEPIFRKSQEAGGAMGGYSNARALARIGSIVSLDGTVDGRQYLTTQAIDKMLEEQSNRFDSCLMGNIRWALGLSLPSIYPAIPNEDGVCSWGGFGGSLVVMDRRRRMTVAYVMNQMEGRMIGNSNVEAYLSEIYKVFDSYKASA